MKAKIKIIDNLKLRNEIYLKTKQCGQKCLSNWALSITFPLLDKIDVKHNVNIGLKESIDVNRLWQTGHATVGDVRNASLKVHKLARETENQIQRMIFRAIGHAIATGHVKSHAIIASDYAIKAIGLLNDNDINYITTERREQLDKLIEIINDIKKR